MVCSPIGKKTALVQLAASAARTSAVLCGQGPSSKVSTTSPGCRKSYCLKCSNPKPGPPVVSISTTRETPSALGWPGQLTGCGVGSGAGAGIGAGAGTAAAAAVGTAAFGATAFGATALGAIALGATAFGAAAGMVAGTSATTVGGAAGLASGASATAGVGTAGVLAHWANTAPKTATHTMIARAHAAAAKRIVQTPNF